MSKNISDYIGKRYGHLVVIGKAPNNSHNPRFNKVELLCDCGNTIYLPFSVVARGERKSCGKCDARKHPKSKPSFNPSEYIGKKFGKLTVIGLSEKLPNEKYFKLDCICDCGNTARVTPYKLANGCTQSCGCLVKEKLQENRSRIGYYEDGRTNHPLFKIWNAMISRCENPKDSHYYCYGARGISVCEEWHNFWNFAKWSDSVGGRPEGYSIDRINNDGNYEPSNCRWATRFQQSINKSNNSYIEYKGVSKTLAEWSIITGININALKRRKYLGWSSEKIIETPLRKRNLSNS